MSEVYPQALVKQIKILNRNFSARYKQSVDSFEIQVGIYRNLINPVYFSLIDSSKDPYVIERTVGYPDPDPTRKFGPGEFQEREVSFDRFVSDRCKNPEFARKVRELALVVDLDENLEAIAVLEREFPVLWTGALQISKRAIALSDLAYFFVTKLLVMLEIYGNPLDAVILERARQLRGDYFHRVNENGKSVLQGIIGYDFRRDTVRILKETDEQIENLELKHGIKLQKGFPPFVPLIDMVKDKLLGNERVREIVPTFPSTPPPPTSPSFLPFSKEVSDKRKKFEATFQLKPY